MGKARIFFLRATVVVVGLVILLISAFWLPSIAAYFARIGPEFAYLQYPVLIGIYLTTVPFFYALFLAMRILDSIDNTSPFTDEVLTYIIRIKAFAIAIALMYILGVLFLNTQGGALTPGVGLLGIIIAFASIVIAVFAGVLQELFESALIYKKENELTI